MPNHPNIRKTLIFSIITVACMFSFSFALSPLYNALCKYTDFNTAVKTTSPPDFGRQITLQFVTTNNENLPWDFSPETTAVTISLEQNKKVLFFAKNNSNKTMTIQAIPSFSPPKAAQYVKKTECFCFSKQTLKAGETIHMPVVFRVIDSLPKDIPIITLSYTLFDVTPGSNKKTRKGFRDETA